MGLYHRTVGQGVRILAPLAGFVLLGLVLLGVTLAESAVRAPAAGRTIDQAVLSEAIAARQLPMLQDVEVVAADGTPLRAWWLKANAKSRGAVVVLHGIGDSRLGALGHADYLHEAGYAVLLPDLRGHGASGGDFVTYGLRERGDLALWQRWMHEQTGQPSYGIGVSLGAAILLQSLPTAEFSAVVTESSFSCFPHIASDRISQFSGGISDWLPPLRWLLLSVAYPYSRVRFGIDLRKACPEESLRADNGRTPVLLIHGSADTNIPIAHSRRLAMLHSRQVTLWEVADAGHVRVLTKAGKAYRERVLRHFALVPHSHGHETEPAIPNIELAPRP